MPYATALDVFLIICFAFVFLALVEYAFIHFVELYVRRVKYKDQDRLIHLQEITKSLTIPVIKDFNLRQSYQAQNRQQKRRMDEEKTKIFQGSKVDQP